MGRRTQEELRHEARDKLHQALAHKLKNRLQDAPGIMARCSLLGNKYGVGVGLYFQGLAFLRLLLLWLALASVPFFVIANTSRFTTEQHAGDGSGVTALPAFNPLQSLTFSALPDEESTGAILTWLNVQLPGVDGVFAMSRSVFLTVISLLDAGSMAVFAIASLLLHRLAAQFARAVDDNTREVADYSVIVKFDLPETTPVDIGHHFSRFGRVVDVVLIKDFGPLLKLASTATALERQRKAAAESKGAHGRKAVARQRQIRRTEKHMAAFMQQASSQLDSAGRFELKAAVITFNEQQHAAACLAACPQRWLASWLQPRRQRFLGEYRFWVERAKPPEDYIFENLSVSRLSRYARMALVRLTVLCILLASAGAVTKLMALNLQAARDIAWNGPAMDSRIAISMQAYPLSISQVAVAAQAANDTLARVAAAAGAAAAEQLGMGSGGYAPLAYCSVQLLQTCSQGLSALLGRDVLLVGADGAVSSNQTAALLGRTDLIDTLARCSAPGSSCPGLSMCHPCHCSLLSRVAPGRVADMAWVLATRQACPAFIDAVNVHTFAFKALISAVIVALNLVIKAALHGLVELEKHWTQSDKERAYAVLAFGSQLLNSVMVLVLVNARSTSASQAINATLSSGAASKYTSWGSNLILSGAYTDFSPAWYADVGQSLELLIILNAVVTAGFAVATWLLRKLHQALITGCLARASQSAYNSAWLGVEFVLDARVSDIMLGVFIVLMFGSGVPSLYLWGLIWLVVVEACDRWSLARLCRTPARYGKSLPDLLLAVLPWAAAAHCAVGCWMHTYFNAGRAFPASDGSSSSSSGGGGLSGLGELGDTAAALTRTAAFQRITQINGLPLLLLLANLILVHVLIRFLLYFFSGRACMRLCGCGGRASRGGSDLVTYEAALLARYANDATSASAAAAAASGRASRAQSTLLKPDALATSLALAGSPTYRLPHHPHYADVFSNPLYKPIWLKAFGRLRFTTLVSRPGGGFLIAPEHVVEDHCEEELQSSLSSMSPDLQLLARRLADGPRAGGGGGASGGKCTPRSSFLGSADLEALRARSRSVQVAVLAGLGFDDVSGSRPGSFTSAGGAFGCARARSMLEPPTGRDASLMAAVAAGGSGLRPASFTAASPLSGGAAAGAFGTTTMLLSPGQHADSSPRHHQPPAWLQAVEADVRGSATLGAPESQQAEPCTSPPGWPTSPAAPAVYVTAPDGTQMALFAVATPTGLVFLPSEAAAAALAAGPAASDAEAAGGQQPWQQLARITEDALAAQAPEAAACSPAAAAGLSSMQWEPQRAPGDLALEQRVASSSAATDQLGAPVLVDVDSGSAVQALEGPAGVKQPLSHADWLRWLPLPDASCASANVHETSSSSSGGGDGGSPSRHEVAPAACLFPLDSLLAAQPQTSSDGYPNVHLTTATLPAGWDLPAAADPGGACFSSALLAGTSSAAAGLDAGSVVQPGEGGTQGPASTDGHAPPPWPQAEQRVLGPHVQPAGPESAAEMVHPVAESHAGASRRSSSSTSSSSARSSDHNNEGAAAVAVAHCSQHCEAHGAAGAAGQQPPQGAAQSRVSAGPSGARQAGKKKKRGGKKGRKGRGL